METENEKLQRHEIADKIYHIAIGLRGVSQILSFAEESKSEGDAFKESHLLILEELTHEYSEDLLEIYEGM